MVHEDIEYEEWIYEAPGPEVHEEVDDFNELESILGELKEEEDPKEREREDAYLTLSLTTLVVMMITQGRKPLNTSTMALI